MQKKTPQTSTARETGQTDFAVMHEFHAPARANLSREAWDYLMGASETETTLLRNRAALDTLALRRRVLRDVEHLDATARFLGHDWRLPVLLAPIGSLQDIVEGGGAVPARAAARFGAAHMLSSVCEPGLEAVAQAAPDHPKIFQIYVRGDAAWVDDLVGRAVDSGYVAVCFTVDLDYFGRRERDVAKRHTPTARRTARGEVYQARFSWKDLERIRRKFDVPLILKGIMDPADAVLAADLGIDAIYVSNHGGRQLDHERGSVDLLPPISEALAGRAEIIVDGGVMRGTDVVKAMALGASAVGVGRLQGLAAAAGGEAGVTRMLELIEEEVLHCLGLMGVTSFAELDANHVEPAPLLGRTGFASAFPLLHEDY